MLIITPHDYSNNLILPEEERIYAALDWSGPLSKDAHAILSAGKATFEYFGGKPAWRDYHGWYKKQYRNFFDSLQDAGIHPDDFGAAQIFGKYGQFLKDLERKGIHAVPYPDIYEALYALARTGHKIEIVSHHPQVEAEARRYGIRHLLNRVRDNILHDKSSHLVEIAKEIGEPDRVIFVTDTPADIEMAHKANRILDVDERFGIQSIAILRPEREMPYSTLKQLKKAKPTLDIVSNLKEASHMMLTYERERIRRPKPARWI
ncbi:MAG: HAD family hydrolase [Candidatus Micrarchaeota archaeon]|nr:HAD family hydrolase [Candidatus Micrarchaeota archaeon]